MRQTVYALLAEMNLPAVMFPDFERVFFRRETIELIAIGQFAGERREFVLAAVTTIRLEPGEDLAHRLNGQVWQQSGDPGPRANQQTGGRIFPSGWSL